VHFDEAALAKKKLYRFSQTPGFRRKAQALLSPDVRADRHFNNSLFATLKNPSQVRR